MQQTKTHTHTHRALRIVPACRLYRRQTYRLRVVICDLRSYTVDGIVFKQQIHNQPCHHPVGQMEGHRAFGKSPVKIAAQTAMAPFSICALLAMAGLSPGSGKVPVLGHHLSTWCGINRTGVLKPIRR